MLHYNQNPCIQFINSKVIQIQGEFTLLLNIIIKVNHSYINVKYINIKYKCTKNPSQIELTRALAYGVRWKKVKDGIFFQSKNHCIYSLGVERCFSKRIIISKLN